MIQLHDMLRSFEKERKKSRASRADMERLMDTMSADLKRLQEEYNICKAAESEAKACLGQARKSEEEARDDLALARRHLEEAREESEELRNKVMDLRVQLGEKTRALTAAEGQVSDLTTQTQMLELKSKEGEAEILDLEQRLKELRGVNRTLTETVKDQEEGIKEFKARIKELGDKLVVAEQRPIISPEIKGEIIKEYKASVDFFNEVVEGSTDAFSKGFELCRSQVQGLSPDFDVTRLKEFSDDDEDELEVEGGTTSNVEAGVEAEEVVEAVVIDVDEVLIETVMEAEVEAAAEVGLVAENDIAAVVEIAAEAEIVAEAVMRTDAEDGEI